MDTKAPRQPKRCSQQPPETLADSRQVLDCCRQSAGLEDLGDQTFPPGRGCCQEHMALVPALMHSQEVGGPSRAVRLSSAFFLSHSLEHWSRRAHMGPLRAMITEPGYTVCMKSSQTHFQVISLVSGCLYPHLRFPRPFFLLY